MKTKITVETEAISINRHYLLVECPVCKKSQFSKYKKLHQHGSEGDLSNRIEHRAGHCCEYTTHFIIHINDNTIREIPVQ